jgi:hypothetical protein
MRLGHAEIHFEIFSDRPRQKKKGQRADSSALASGWPVSFK